jgi:RNA polymerase sigma-70 factor (ECF subfamily)
MVAYNSYTDNELTTLLQESNEAAFTEIYNRYWQQLFFVAHKRLSSAEDAKEIIQTVFFNLWQKREKLQIQSLPLYLAGMTRFAIYRFFGNEKRRSNILRTFQQTESHKVTESFDIDNKQLLEILTQLTSELPEKYRIIFIQHKLLDRPLEEVAEILGVSSRTAEGYVSKVMEIMRQHHRKLNFAILLL